MTVVDWQPVRQSVQVLLSASFTPFGFDVCLGDSAKSITIEGCCTCDPPTPISQFKLLFCCRKGHRETAPVVIPETNFLFCSCAHEQICLHTVCLFIPFLPLQSCNIKLFKKIFCSCCPFTEIQTVGFAVCPGRENCDHMLYFDWDVIFVFCFWEKSPMVQL